MSEQNNELTDRELGLSDEDKMWEAVYSNKNEEPLPTVAEIMAMGEESLKNQHPSLYAYMEGLNSLPSQQEVTVKEEVERTLTLSEVEAIVAQMGLDSDLRKFALQVAATMYNSGRSIDEVVDAAGKFEAYLTHD